MNVDLAIFMEMAALWGGTLLLFTARHPGVPLRNVLVNIGIPASIATLMLMALLTGAADVSHAKWPAYLGLLIASSAILAEGTVAAQAFDAGLTRFSTFAIEQKNIAIQSQQTSQVGSIQP